jgi:hypothetical protein
MGHSRGLWKEVKDGATWSDMQRAGFAVRAQAAGAGSHQRLIAQYYPRVSICLYNCCHATTGLLLLLQRTDGCKLSVCAVCAVPGGSAVG